MYVSYRFWAVNIDDGMDCSFYTTDQGAWENKYHNNPHFKTWIERVTY